MTQEGEPPRRGRKPKEASENRRALDKSLYSGERPDIKPYTPPETGPQEDGTCRHRWLLSPGFAAGGVCKHCGEANYFDGGEMDTYRGTKKSREEMENSPSAPEI